MTKPDIFCVYNKAKAVINSCQNADQIPAARNYVNLFLITFSKPSSKARFKPAKMQVDSATSAMYEELKKHLKILENKFTD